MPRKLFKIESAPKPDERPGSGSPDDSGVRRKPRREEPNVILDAGYKEELETPPERHARLQGMVGELVGMEKERMKQEATEEGVGIKKESPADRSAGAKKAIRELNKERKEIDVARRKTMATLRSHGLGTVADIEAALSDMSPELRAKTLGQRPSFGYRARKFFHQLSGRDRDPEVDEALKRYNELDQQGYANRRALWEAEQLLGSTEQPKKIRETEKMQTQIEQVKKEEKKSEDTSKLRRVWETAAQIEDEIKNLEAMTEDLDVAAEWGNMEKKQNDFSARIRQLESGGTGEEYDEALQKAEDALARYAVALHRRRGARPEAVQEAARTAGKGEARPFSKIGMRAGQEGNYGTSKQERRTVEHLKKELPDSSKRDLAAERMKAVMEHRSKPTQSKLLAEINKESTIRAKMHKIYEDFNSRWNQLQKEGNEKAVMLQTSPDPALDYALNVYQAFAKDNGKFVFSAPERAECLNDVKSANADLGWATDENIGEDMEAVLKVGPPSVSELAAFSTKARKERAKQEQPLPHIKRAESEAELNKIEELDIPIEVEKQVMRPVVEKLSKKQQEEFDARAKKVHEDSLTDQPAIQEQPLELDLTEFVKEEEERKGKPAVEKKVVAPAKRKVVPHLTELADELRKANLKNQEEKNSIIPGALTRRKQESRLDTAKAFSEAERLNIREALNGRMLALGKTWIEATKKRTAVKDEILRRLGTAHNWMDLYIDKLDAYRQQPEGEVKAKLRKEIEGLNQLLGIKDPRDLLAGESEAVRKAIREKKGPKTYGEYLNPPEKDIAQIRKSDTIEPPPGPSKKAKRGKK